MLPLPPCHVIDDFLPGDVHRALIDWTLSSEARFEAATVDSGVNRVEANTRRNLVLRDLGPAGDAVRAALLAALPEIAAALGTALGTAAPEDAQLELEISAYGDGDFYRPHIDTATRRAADGEPARAVSAVYYFHRQPRAFEGGALRLLPWEGEDGARDIAPLDNRLAAFLSWARHEVLAVRSPSGRFEDRRFALNCWYLA